MNQDNDYGNLMNTTGKLASSDAIIVDNLDQVVEVTDLKTSPGTEYNVFEQQQQMQQRNINETDDSSNSNLSSQIIYTNFIWMSVFFSANHGCVVACLSLATARLGSIGAWQSGILYGTYSFSGIVGSTYIVKVLGSRNALVFGMGLYCAYVGAFYVATILPQLQRPAAFIGAILGGIGAGFLWTAQGSYYTTATKQYKYVKQQQHNNENDDNNSINEDDTISAQMASIFAFIYLASEVALRSLSTILLRTVESLWSTIFAMYAIVAIVSTIFMYLIVPKNDNYNNEHTTIDAVDMSHEEQQNEHDSDWYKVTATYQLLRNDAKMKYMIGLNAVFGFTSSFLTSYVNGQVVHTVLHNDDYVGVLTAWVSCVAAGSSLLFGYITSKIGSNSQGPILIIGSICFSFVAIPFLLWPNITIWTWVPLLFIYTMHGIGRSTFESTLRSTFAEFFPYEKEGAFANIILQNGLSSSIGFILTFSLTCTSVQQDESYYCVQYRDGTYHDVLSFELLVVITAILAIGGYWRAASLNEETINSGQTNYDSLPNAEEVDDETT